LCHDARRLGPLETAAAAAAATFEMIDLHPPTTTGRHGGQILGSLRQPKVERNEGATWSLALVDGGAAKLCETQARNEHPAVRHIANVHLSTRGKLNAFGRVRLPMLTYHFNKLRDIDAY
jgi:hypothetical protein